MKNKLTQTTTRFVTFLRRRWKTIGIVLIIIALLVVWYLRSQAANQKVSVFGHPTRQDLTKTLEVSGSIDAKQKVRLRFLAGGKVVYIGAQEGDMVKKYQTIATIDRATLQKQLEQDLNTSIKERNDLNNTREEIDDYVLNETLKRTENNAQLDLNNSVLQVEIRDIAINNTVLSAPFAGILTSAPTAVPGVQLLSTDYFEIVNPETLIFIAEVDEADIGLVGENMPAVITLDAFPDLEITSQISRIDFTSSETTSGTVFFVEFPVDQNATSSLLRLGMNGDADIRLQSKSDVLTIPLIATRERDDKTYVDVRTGEQSFEEREIKVGLETDEYVEVLDGLSENDEILLPE